LVVRSRRDHRCSIRADGTWCPISPVSAPRARAVSGADTDANRKATEKKDAQLAREVEIALPRELSRAQAVALAREFAEQFAARDMVADVVVPVPPAVNETPG